MARPQSFNSDKALAAAMTLFWQRGYEATSLQQLVQAMGVNRASLYNSFGDKKALFRSCLGRYRQQVQVLVMQASNGSKNGFDALNRFFSLSFTLLPEDLLRQGCFAVNTVSELSLVDEELVSLADDALNQVMAGLLEQILRGQGDGSINVSMDANEIAGNLMNMIRGLRIGLQGGMELNEVKKVINFNLKMLEV